MNDSREQTTKALISKTYSSPSPAIWKNAPSSTPSAVGQVCEALGASDSVPGKAND